MRSFAARILVALLVLSQTWMGALRGLELCIPIGQCDGCRDAVGEAEQGGRSPHDDHAHTHTHAHFHAHAHADGDRLAVHHGDEGCICHIHVATPDDDTHRGPAPSAGLLIATDLVGTVEAFLLALGTPEALERPESPPERDGRTPPEQASIASTVLLV